MPNNRTKGGRQIGGGESDRQIEPVKAGNPAGGRGRRMVEQSRGTPAGPRNREMAETKLRSIDLAQIPRAVPDGPTENSPGSPVLGSCRPNSGKSRTDE